MLVLHNPTQLLKKPHDWLPPWQKPVFIQIWQPPSVFLTHTSNTDTQTFHILSPANEHPPTAITHSPNYTNTSSPIYLQLWLEAPLSVFCVPFYSQCSSSIAFARRTRTIIISTSRPCTASRVDICERRPLMLATKSIMHDDMIICAYKVVA